LRRFGYGSTENRERDIHAEPVHLLAHNLEDGLRVSLTGLQDQLAAAYGGINKWVWLYSKHDAPFERHALIDKAHYETVQGCVLIAYTGEERWTPIFEPQGAFFKLAFFEAAPVVVSCLLLRA